MSYRHSATNQTFVLAARNTRSPWLGVPLSRIILRGRAVRAEVACCSPQKAALATAGLERRPLMRRPCCFIRRPL